MVLKSAALEFLFWRYEVKPYFTPILEQIGVGFAGFSQARIHVSIFLFENNIF